MPADTISEVGWNSWFVPDNVKVVQIDLRGAGSGDTQGGRIFGSYQVDPGDRLWVFIGEKGKFASGPNAGGSAQGGGGHGGEGYGTGHRGGDGGGGATYVRHGTHDGLIVAVAGGAGGKADNAPGGEGGDGHGGPGTKQFSSSVVDAPTGGTQTASGLRAINHNNDGFSGDRGGNSMLALGGHGGQQDNGASDGGGGGGGGYFPGSGGAARGAGGPATGGSGGSNFTGRLYNEVGWRGEGQVGNGLAVMSWSTDPILNFPPTPPTEVTINDLAEAEGLPTSSQTGPIKIEAQVNDPNHRDVVRLVLQLSKDKSPFTVLGTHYSEYVTAAERATVTLTGLAPNTHYYARLFGQNPDGKISTGHNAVDFWTNRPPLEPVLVSPNENATFSPDLGAFPIVFDWQHVDPDDPEDKTTGWELRYRVAATTMTSPGDWVKIQKLPSVGQPNVGTTYTLETLLTPGLIYEWSVRTRDSQFVWGPWALERSWYSLGTTTPPRPEHPTRGEAVSTEEDNEFRWTFIDPSPNDSQINADIRYRRRGEDDNSWINLIGQEAPVPLGNTDTNMDGLIDENDNPTTGIPGLYETWMIPAFTLDAGYEYEWQVRTLDSSRDQSAWSGSAYFWTAPLSVLPDDPAFGVAQGSLGCGETRVFVYQQGGQVLVGEVTPLTQVVYMRKRDDISTCVLFTNGFDQDCGEMLGNLHCWLHELVVFRDGKRVWEGPITRLGYMVDQVEIEAQDVMAYTYRRIMRQGYDDSYHKVGNRQFGLTSVVERARRIIMNALAPWDPNVLPYLTALPHSNDAKQSRVVPDYAKTAWEEVDDLAATGGLDYTAVGRRITLWDVHRPLGRLPELRDKDFSEPPVVTEYGMQLSNYFAVTNNAGHWGAVTQEGGFDPYGPVEMLSSAYGESDTQTGSESRAGHTALVATLEEQAARGLVDRWPTPVVVRVPDNAQLSAEAPVTLDQLVPGVWLPVYSQGTCRKLGQWQKLDSVTVEVTSGEEAVRVVMSPAPGSGEDPDQAGQEGA